jgi:sulfopyruvate decarboxylase alpha subunit
MAWDEIVFERLLANQIDYITNVPDLVLGRLVRRLEEDSQFDVVTATREDEAVALVGGAYLGGRKGAVLLQSSGFGNTMNALGSLMLPYQIPFLLFISMRGDLGEFNRVQVPMGRAVPDILRAFNIPTYTLEREEKLAQTIDGATRLAFTTWTPVAFLLTTLLTGGKEG